MSTSFNQLPFEVIYIIVNQLDNDDYYSAIQANKLFNTTTHLDIWKRKFRRRKFKEELKLKYWNMNDIIDLVWYCDLDGIKYQIEKYRNRLIDSDEIHKYTKEHGKYTNNNYFYDIIGIPEYFDKYIINRSIPYIEYAFREAFRLSFFDCNYKEIAKYLMKYLDLVCKMRINIECPKKLLLQCLGKDFIYW